MQNQELQSLQKPTEKFNLKMFFSVWEHPIFSTLTAFCFFLIFAALKGHIFSISTAPYYNYLADAFLHGQLNLRLIPPSVHDLIFYSGNFYLYWPPFPAVLMMPFVALFGVQFSDIFFTIVVGSLIVGMLAVFFRLLDEKGLIHLSQFERGALVFFFATGTVYTTLAPMGGVWFTSQVIAFGCVLLAYYSAVKYEGRKAFFVTGIWVGLAMMTRSNIILAAIWPAWYLLNQYFKDKKRIVEYILCGISPILFFGSLYLLYNYLRFGNPLDIGYSYHLMAQLFRDDFNKYGPFNIRYIPINLYYQYVAYPFLDMDNFFMGGSLFLLSPLFLLAIAGFVKNRKSASAWFLLLSILVVNGTIITLMGTGWVQFGPRYTLDFTLPLLMLTAMGVRNQKPSVISILVLISFFHYFVGTYLFALAVL